MFVHAAGNTICQSELLDSQVSIALWSICPCFYQMVFNHEVICQVIYNKTCKRLTASYKNERRSTWSHNRMTGNETVFWEIYSWHTVHSHWNQTAHSRFSPLAVLDHFQASKLTETAKKKQQEDRNMLWDVWFTSIFISSVALSTFCYHGSRLERIYFSLFAPGDISLAILWKDVVCLWYFGQHILYMCMKCLCNET